MDNFPTWVKRALIDQKSVPDALMYNFMGDTYTIVEVKYCRDTDKATQRAKAIQQHQHLCESLAASPNHDTDQQQEQDTDMAELSAAIASSAQSTRVHQVTILLGVTGVIHTETVERLTALGISGPALKTLLTDLHYTAIHGLERIWRQRGALIKQLGRLKWANYSKTKRTHMKRACKTPSHRKSNKKRKYRH
jgi:hypothetical protein